MYKIFSIFVLICIIFTLGFKNEAFVDIKISRGETAVSIAENLYKNKIIKNKSAFLFLLKLRGASNKLKTGIYRFSVPTNSNKVIDTLIEGRSVLVKVTFPEGFTSKQIAQRLASHGLGNYAIFMKIINEEKLEGYLYPETYYFDPMLHEQEILDIMKAEFHKELDEMFDTFDFSKFKKYKFSRTEALVLASMIEKEAKLKTEQRLISSVFHNRLRKNWRLESCATIQYALGETKKRLLYKDLKIDSPYNTYLHLGLPPTPICNPGKDAVYAALYPEQTELFFFVRDGDEEGSHKFSRYYNQHINAQNRRG